MTALSFCRLLGLGCPKITTRWISQLMEVVPVGTVDPTPSFYNQTMYLMAGLLVIALLANFFMKPVHHSHHMKATD